MLKIRRAVAEDSPQILKFIKALAEFEKLSHEVVATEKTLKKTIFDQKKAEVYIAETVDKTPVGFALCFETYSTFLAKPGLYLEDLFITPDQRGNGYGTTLLKHLASIAKDRDFGRFEWSVLDWNQKAIDLYEKIGAKPQKEWTVYRLSGDALDAFAKT
jgi:GNAT superfamily N-acetyltransferase